MLLNLIEKHLYSNNFNDQAIVSVEKVIGIEVHWCIACRSPANDQETDGQVQGITLCPKIT